ncbi:tyrosine-type recombinase/integrase [Tropicimonas sp. TH_r6]|uniref:tyrosine-type recombinase/integrase n=1 Tax=Tropicimonas sp. TH_r6 TaxID=3082085 RepID=UPI0029538C7D|nr:tyrosine-type recombinase/integrase [Tropicimonas sp. TH_r6]MDV7141752.1 tyrosine-type recombinase/integrase [Tropicimonas sp. TH_r6]
MPDNIYKQNGSKNWYLRIKIDGVERRESLRTNHRRTAEKKARERIRELKGQISSGALELRFVEGFADFCEALKAGDLGWGTETRKRYMVSARQIGETLFELFVDLGRDIHSIQASEIDVATISEFVSRRREEECSVATINRDLTAFRHLMNYMLNKKMITENPMDMFVKQGMKEVLPDIVLPTRDDVGKLSSRAPGTLAWFPDFLDATGGRAKETALLQWTDISGFSGEGGQDVQVTYRKTKGGKIRTVTLRPEAVAILRDIPRSPVSPYVFWNDTAHGHYKDVSNLFWQYGQEVEFGSRLHDLRHKFAIERLKEGWSIYRVSQYIGHGSILTTERYYFRYLTQEEQIRARADAFNGIR